MTTDVSIMLKSIKEDLQEAEGKHKANNSSCIVIHKFVTIKKHRKLYRVEKQFIHEIGRWDGIIVLTAKRSYASRC